MINLTRVERALKQECRASLMGLSCWRKFVLGRKGPHQTLNSSAMIQYALNVVHSVELPPTVKISSSNPKLYSKMDLSYPVSK